MKERDSTIASNIRQVFVEDHGAVVGVRHSTHIGEPEVEVACILLFSRTERLDHAISSDVQ
jgi:hypothetical protein